MAEKSILWTTGALGDGAAAYGQAEAIRWQRQQWAGDNASEGVHKGYANELEVALGDVGPPPEVDVAAGAASVYGFPYWSTVVESVEIPIPVISARIDRIVLRASWAAQTVRITRVAGTEGAGAPALVQIDGTTWDIPLAQVGINTLGALNITDEREFLHPNIEVETAMLEDLAVTEAKINALAVTEGKIGALAVTSGKVGAGAIIDGKQGVAFPIYRRQGGSATIWSTAGTTTYTPGAGARIQVGAQNTDAVGYLAVTFPVAYAYLPLVSLTAFGSGNRYINIVTVSTTGFTVQASVAASVLFHWLAVGPSA